MKPYFAKYLPVEGDPKEGDMVIYKVIGWTENYEDAVKAATYGDPLPIKVKLFLCSRDIQVGDKVIDEKFQEQKVIRVDGIQAFLWFKSSGLKTPFSHNSTFKVIGEISPEATWVTEGMEFDKEDIEWDDKVFLFDGKGQYLIKCPTCKKFH